MPWKALFRPRSAVSVRRLPRLQILLLNDRTVCGHIAHLPNMAAGSCVSHRSEPNVAAASHIAHLPNTGPAASSSSGAGMLGLACFDGDDDDDDSDDSS